MKFVLTFIMALMASVLGSQVAGATLLFQSIPNLGIDPVDEARCSACGDGQGRYQVFDIFHLDTMATITDMQFVSSAHDFPSSPTALIHSVSSGLPAELLWSERYVSSCPPGGCVFQPYNYTLTPFDTAILHVHPTALTLPAGDYDISFYNRNGFFIPDFHGGSGKLMQRLGVELGDADGCPCTFFPELSLGFSLYGETVEPPPPPIPEPSTLAILGVGLLGSFGVRALRLKA